MVQLSWNKCEGDQWCSFGRVDLTSTHFSNMDGVYIIWQEGGKVIRVGQGVIKDRISAHRSDPQINRFQNLFVSWARVPAHQKDGIERYLADQLQPLVGDAFPNVLPIEVNLP